MVQADGLRPPTRSRDDSSGLADEGQAVRYSLCGFDFNAHAARGAHDLALGALDVDSIEVFHLDLGDLAQLLAGDLADFDPVGFRGPFVNPKALRSRSATGGVLVIKVKLPSAKMVSSTGIMLPAWLDVRALYSLQKAIMLIPCGPKAGPTGGAGVALPAGICSLTKALTFFTLYPILPNPAVSTDQV